MESWQEWLLIAFGLGAIVLLALFIYRQRDALSADQRRSEKAGEFARKRRESMIQSIRILAQAVEAGQVESSEACLRIKGLLDHVEPTLLQKSPFAVFQQVHDKLQHMPTHQARLETEPKFVSKMDKERYAIEQGHADEIRLAATAIRAYVFSEGVS
ncbi:hypothetical protein ABA45_02900 [Marinobacter psychrophilus]|jgi:hypothetical protein|uniref:DUF2489 domain-containing protein n=1 Tax=Marinobacter psychrophilus TaxID=330734 RepID=A0A0H4HXR8_9GAMM|nr:DUF2489 domain-containing protein [Marinobacter psychrophilus]AKO51499.1 hypothetical protein ABA45_02900 [Marinobacter psychrophilus]